MIKLCVFDAYGTLFDVAAAARQLAEAPGRGDLAAVWPQVSADWRAKQLAYSWLRAAAGDHVDFWQVTQDGLDWALERAGLSDPVLREDLLALYWQLPAYREVPEVLARLKVSGRKVAILSNGSKDMLDGAVGSAGIAEYLDAVLSVDAVGVFKPARAVYDLVGTRFGVAPDEVMFVSANGWDAAFGAAYGFNTVWVNRAAEPMDRLSGAPGAVVEDLRAIPERVGA